MTKATDEFAELIKLARQNDPEARAQLCQQYEPKLRVVARVLLGPALRPHLDSMDLVQSVHRTLLMGLDHQRFDISSPEKLIALALTIVRRKVARQWRSARRQQRLSAGGATIDPLPLLLQNLGSTEPDPATVTQSREQIELLCRQLTPQDRRILQMRADGYSTLEIASKMQINHSTVRVRMMRLRERLRSNGLVSDWL